MSKKDNKMPEILEQIFDDIEKGRITEEDLKELHERNSCLCPVCTIEHMQKTLCNLCGELEYLKTFFIDDEDDEDCCEDDDCCDCGDDDECYDCDEEETEKVNEILDGLLDVVKDLKKKVNE